MGHSVMSLLRCWSYGVHSIFKLDQLKVVCMRWVVVLMVLVCPDSRVLSGPGKTSLELCRMWTHLALTNARRAPIYV